MTSAPPLRLDEAALRAWPLPKPDDDGDKNDRGRVLVIAGSRQMPGAAVLAATAALRAGAGKMQIASAASVAALIAMAVPESRVIALPETPDGAIDAALAAKTLRSFAEHADAVLVGPGMDDDAATVELVIALMPHLSKASLALDASAMNVLCAASEQSKGSEAKRSPEAAIVRFVRPVLLTPHAGEMARLCRVSKEAVEADPVKAAVDAAERWNAIVALKGRVTIIAVPRLDDEPAAVWQHMGGNVGLATSGSGDTLAGIVAGLAARGAPLAQACAWGVVLHARAGDELSRATGPVGYLAREIPACIPALMERLSGD